MKALNRFLFHRPWLYKLIRIGLGCTFIWAGTIKLMAPHAFAKVISGYDLLPDIFLVPVALGLPLIELLAGLGLAFEIRGSLGAVSGLLLIFLIVVSYGIARNLEVDCGCFSVEEINAKKGLKAALYRDFGLMAIALYLAAWRWVGSRSAKASGA